MRRIGLREQIKIMFIHFLGKLEKAIKKAVFAFINAFITIIVVCLRPIVRVKIVNISADRIGHLAFQGDLFLRKLQCLNEKDHKKTAYIGITQLPSANKQLLKMFSREMVIIPCPIMIYRLIIRSIKNNAMIYVDFMTKSYSEFEIFNNTEVNLKFTPEENAKGIELLREMGITQVDWFVCFQSRDSKYLQKNGRDLYGFQRDFSYHDYRDCSIKNFILAAEYIASKGGLKY